MSYAASVSSPGGGRARFRRATTKSCGIHHSAISTGDATAKAKGARRSIGAGDKT